MKINKCCFINRALREYNSQINEKFKHHKAYDIVLRDFSIYNSFGIRAAGNLYCKFKYKYRGKTRYFAGEYYLGKLEVCITYKYFICDVKTWWVSEKHRPQHKNGRWGTTMPSLYTIVKKGSLKDLCMYADLRIEAQDCDQTFTEVYEKYYTQGESR